MATYQPDRAIRYNVRSYLQAMSKRLIDLLPAQNVRERDDDDDDVDDDADDDDC